MQFANSFVCSDLLSNSWNAIQEISPISSDHPISYACKVLDPSNQKRGSIITFWYTGDTHLKQVEHDLVNSWDASFPLFEVVSTKVKAPIDNFASLQHQLSALKDQIDISCPLIITGHSLGGSIASLFTLWLLKTIYLTTSKFPLCITFGSPLLGDNAFHQAISERPTWTSCFVHVISNNDPVLRFSMPRGHKPFGMTVFLSESGCSCFEDSESVLEVMNAIRSDNHEVAHIVDYGKMLNLVKYNVIRKRRSKEMDKCNRPSNPIQVGITLQLLAVGAIKEKCETTSALTKSIGKRFESSQRQKKRILDQPKKFNEIKIYMVYMGRYKRVARDFGGYYDCYKNAWSKSGKEVKRKEDMVRHHRILNHYWQQMVTEIERIPKREGESKILARWLYGGTTYRRMVEPLDIAEYYRQGKTDYINKGRSRHYKVLEQWEKDASSSEPAERCKVASLTVDSCFWARVEEALIVCGLLKNCDNDCLETKEALFRNLTEFENYVMSLIRKLELSVEIFVEGSSFMKWWKDYKQIKGVYYQSHLTAFMNNENLEGESIILDDYKKSS